MESNERRPRGPAYDLRAHMELARAFPALAARLRPLLLTEIEIECPSGHKLKVIAQLVAGGRAVYCPKCRLAFLPLLDPEVEVPSAFLGVPPPDSAPPKVPQLHGFGLARQGLARMAEGAGLLLRAAGGAVFGRRSPLGRLLRHTGGWLTSSALHAALLVLIMLLGVGTALPPPERVVTLESAVTPEERQKFLEERAKSRDVFAKDHQVVRIVEVPPPELPEAAPEPPEDIPEEKRLAPPGLPMPLRDIPEMPREVLASPGVSGVTGLGPGGASGTYSLRGDRGLRLGAARRGGGGPDTENAVERALGWLARNRNADGSWDLDGRGRSTAPERWRALGQDMRPAMTGLAVLAFLGAGYTQRSEGRYGKAVREGLAWLVENQAANGSYPGRNPRCCYAQAIAALALSEALAVGGDPDKRLGPAAQKTVDFMAESRNPYAGWDYTPRGGTSDTSVTVWNCMALKSARIAGLHVDDRSFQGIVGWLDAAQDRRTGGFAYRGRPGGDRLQRAERVTVMHAAGLMMRLLTGTRPETPEAGRPAALLREMLPRTPEGGPDEKRIGALVADFVRRNHMRWELLGGAERERVRAEAERAVASAPRTVEEYLARTYGERWSYFTPGQRAALRETARQVIAATPRTVEEYIDRHYRQWNTFSDEERGRELAYARRVAEEQLYGPAFPESIYFLYHSSLAMFQMGGDDWKRWNRVMKGTLLSSQVTDGRDEGSWAPSAGHGMCACIGRTMATAMGALTLEVYYRYLPMYSK